MGEFIGRSPKTVPSEGRGSHHVHNPPDAPTTRRVPLPEASTFVSNTAPVDRNNGHIVEEVRLGDSKDALRLTPYAHEPLTLQFRTPVGGGRFGGSGTSREALRRAKRKARAANSR